MLKRYAKFMKYGKTVVSNWTAEEYELIENMDSEKEFVKAVSMEHVRRYGLLKTWIKNWVDDSCGFRKRFSENIEDCQKEKAEYETLLKISDISAGNTIRFITPHYETKFKVKDLSCIRIGTAIVRVAYLDEYHFKIAEMIQGKAPFYEGQGFHIYEFAERCEKDKIHIEPVKSAFLPC